MTLLESVMKKLGYDNKRKFIFSITMDIIILTTFVVMIIALSGCSCVVGLSIGELRQMGCDLSSPLVTKATDINFPTNFSNFTTDFNLSSVR